MTRSKLTTADVRRVCGPLPGSVVQEILGTGADLEALEEARSWASGDDEHTPERHLAPSSPAARVYAILAALDEREDDARRPGQTKD